jgi:hypothetical protein
VTARTAARLAWSLWGLAMVLEVAAVALWLANHAVLISRPGTPDDFIPHIFLVPGYATVGAVIAARQRNRIGWLFLVFGLLAALLSFDNTYFMRGAIVTPGSLPAARVVIWAGTVLWPSGFLFLALLLLLFPDGRLPSPRWRPVALALAGSWSLFILNVAFAPGTTIQQGIRFTNPMGSRRSVTPPGRRWPRAQPRSRWPPLPLPRWGRCCAFAAPTRCNASS